MKIQKAINSLFRPIKLNFLHNLLLFSLQLNLLKKNDLCGKYFLRRKFFCFIKLLLQYDTKKESYLKNSKVSLWRL